MTHRRTCAADADTRPEELHKQDGVWVAYGLDHSEHWSTTVFPDETSALRYALANYLRAGFLRYGDSLDKAAEPATRPDGR